MVAVGTNALHLLPRRDVCKVTGLQSLVEGETGFSSYEPEKKSKHIVEGVPAGDIASKCGCKTSECHQTCSEGLSIRVNIEKAFNPMFNDKKGSKKFTDCEGTPNEFKEELAYKDPLTKNDLTPLQLQTLARQNFFNNTAVFQANQNSQITKVLTGKQALQTEFTDAKTSKRVKLTMRQPQANEKYPFWNLVLIYHPNCGHCRDFKPEYIQLA